MHFDEQRKLIVATDGSSDGVGALRNQEHADTRKHNMNYTSTTLTCMERNNSQIKKAVLSVVYTFKRIKQFVAGREVIYSKDHQQLT